MIIYHQNNVAAFAGNHVYYWFGQPLFGYRISVDGGASPTGGPFPFYIRRLHHGGMIGMGR